MEYIITVDEEQLKVINSALDFYSRVMTGQLEEIIDPVNSPLRDRLIKIDDREDFELCIEKMKGKVFPEAPIHGSLGIGNVNTKEEAKMAYDMYQVFRHKIAWTNKPQGGIQVDFDNPLKFSHHKLPTIQIKEES
jgi:hypothetical protein